MLLRGVRIQEGHPPDEFPDLLDDDHIEAFLAFLQSILSKYERFPTASRPSAISHLEFYLNWIKSPEPRDPFPQEHWMDDGSVNLFAETDYPFSLTIGDTNMEHSFITTDWVEICSDSVVLRLEPVFTLGETTNLIQRNNMGTLLGAHFFPLPSLTNPMDELNNALYSLAQKLRLNYAAVNVPKQLIRNMVVSGHNIELQRREYMRDMVSIPAEGSSHHIQESLASSDSPDTAEILSSNSPLAPPSNTSCICVTLPKLDILLDTYGLDTTLGIALSQDSTDSEAQLSMERLITTLMANTSSEAGEVLRSHLLLDSTLKLRVWKPMTNKLYSKCVPDGTCGFQFMYQMYLRGFHQIDGEQFPILFSEEHLVNYKNFLQGLVLKYENSARYLDEVEQVRVYHSSGLTDHPMNDVVLRMLIG